MGGKVVDREELWRETGRLVGLTSGVKGVVAGGRLEDRGRVEIVEYAGMIVGVDVSGVGCTELVVLPFQTIWQGLWDRAASTLSQA